LGGIEKGEWKELGRKGDKRERTEMGGKGRSGRGTEFRRRAVCVIGFRGDRRPCLKFSGMFFGHQCSFSG